MLSWICNHTTWTRWTANCPRDGRHPLSLCSFKFKILVQIFFVTAYSKTHLRFGFTCSTGQSTARIASSNTVFRPFWVNALHSRYFTAPISFAMARPCERRTSLQIMNVVMFQWNVTEQRPWSGIDSHHKYIRK